MARTIAFTSEHFPGRPVFDTAVSKAILEGVSAGHLPETVRLYVPDRMVAFGARDAVHPRFDSARSAAAEAGFSPIVRLAGGRAAVFHEHTLAFAWAIPESRPRETIAARFDEIGELLVEALGRLGVDARIGEVPGEYCPGDSSINARGVRKLAGVGQRLVGGAAHVGGVIVVDRPDLVNAALIPVYRALDVEWDPAATGSVADEVAADVASVASVVSAVFGDRHHLRHVTLDEPTLTRAAEIASSGPDRR